MRASEYKNIKQTLEKMYPRQVGKVVAERLKAAGIAGANKSMVANFFAGRIKTRHDIWLSVISQLIEEGKVILEQRRELMDRCT